MINRINDGVQLEKNCFESYWLQKEEHGIQIFILPTCTQYLDKSDSRLNVQLGSVLLIVFVRGLHNVINSKRLINQLLATLYTQSHSDNRKHFCTIKHQERTAVI